MRHVIQVILVLSAITTSFKVTAASEDCDGASGTTRSQSCISNKSYGEFDKELNRRYQKMLAIYKERGAIKDRELLIAAQRAWVRFKEDSCKFEQEFYGGAYSKNLLECQARLTAERIEYLKEYEFAE